MISAELKDETHEVAIVGAGPTGLVLALALARHGIRTLVLEAEEGLVTDLRAAAFHPPTMEMLDALDLAGAMLEIGIKVPVWEFRDRQEGPIATFDLGLLADETPFPYRFHLEQHKLSALALDRLRGMEEARLLFGHEVTAVAQDESGVALTVEAGGETAEIRAPWIVGADGGRSVVRKSLPVEFEGFTWPEKFLVTSTPYELYDHGFAGASYIADPDNWAALFKIPHEGPPGLWRVAYSVDADGDEAAQTDPKNVLARLKDVFAAVPVDWEKFPLVYTSCYRVQQRVADRFHVGRVVLAGDAAHINNPLGGFGLNAGIHDAANLADKLAKVLREAGDADKLFDLYTRQRRPANIEAVQQQSIRNKRLLAERDPKVRRARLEEMRATAADRERARAFLLNSSMIASVRKAAEVR